MQASPTIPELFITESSIIYITSMVNVYGNDWQEMLSSITTEMTEIPPFLTFNIGVT